MNRFISRTKLIAVFCILLTGLSAGAATIWSDDFESGMTQWSDVWTGGTGTAGIEANPSGSGNVLHIKSDAGSDYAAVRTGFMSTTFNQSTEFHVQFDVYFPSNAWQQTFHIFSGYNQLGPDIVFRWSEDHRSSTFDYTPDVQTDSGWQEVTTSGISGETWTTIYIEAPGDGTYDMYIGSYDNFIGTFDLRDGDWNRIYMGDGSGSSYSGEYYIDNIQITDTAVSVAKTFFSDDFEGGLGQWADVWTGGNGTVGIEANPLGVGNVLHVNSPEPADYAGTRSVNIGTSLSETNEFHVEFDVYFPSDAWMQTFNVFFGWNNIGPHLAFRASEDHRPGGAQAGTDYTMDIGLEGFNQFQILSSPGIPAETWTRIYIDATGDGYYDLHIGSYDTLVGTFDVVDGAWSQFYLGEGSSSGYSGEYYIDNIQITDTYQNQDVELIGYEAWAFQWGGTNVIGSGSADYDSDGVNNLYEYGLGGNPVDDQDQGTAPLFSVVSVGGSNVCSYIHPQLSDSESGLAYALALATDLITGDWVTNSGYMVSGTNVTGETLDFVTNVTDTVGSQKFIRLIIE